MTKGKSQRTIVTGGIERVAHLPLLIGFADGPGLVVARATHQIWIGRVTLAHHIASDIPGDGRAAEPGVYDAVSNRRGAVSVVLEDGALLGVKPSEYEPFDGHQET